MTAKDLPPGFQDMLSLGLVEALLDRRSRRFFMGAEIPDGVFAYTSVQKALPLTDLEKMLVVCSCGDNTSWHHMIYRAAPYAPHLDLDCYDKFYKPGAYLKTHAIHLANWHSDKSPLKPRK